MRLEELKAGLRDSEAALDVDVFVQVARFAAPAGGQRPTAVAVTARLRKACRKTRSWGSPQMLTALKNAAYGFNDERSRSRGGSDGVFLLDRRFRPQNAMMRKLFDRYLDRPGSGAEELADALGVALSSLKPVRVVSHHLRLLGVLRRTDHEDLIVLVDCDASD